MVSPAGASRRRATLTGRDSSVALRAPMSQQPEPTPEEQDAPLERRQEEDAQRYPGHEDPERVIDPDPDTES